MGSHETNQPVPSIWWLDAVLWVVVLLFKIVAVVAVAIYCVLTVTYQLTIGILLGLLGSVLSGSRSK